VVVVIEAPVVPGKLLLCSPHCPETLSFFPRL